MKNLLTIITITFCFEYAHTQLVPIVAEDHDFFDGLFVKKKPKYN